jgi:hypothetical protein
LEIITLACATKLDFSVFHSSTTTASFVRKYPLRSRSATRLAGLVRGQTIRKGVTQGIKDPSRVSPSFGD